MKLTKEDSEKLIKYFEQSESRFVMTDKELKEHIKIMKELFNEQRINYS